MKKNIYIFLIIISLPLTIYTLLNVAFVAHFKYYRLALLALLITESVLLLKITIKTAKRDWIKNIALSVFSTFLILILLEGTFLFIPRSHGSGYSLAGRLWFIKYWKLNSFGYRDEEPNEKTPAIFFVGDSFTAGQGIKDVNDRFSNIVKSKLKETNKLTNVINIGENGLGTTSEFNKLITFTTKTGIKPKKIILQYFGNDIDDAAFKNGIQFQTGTVYSGISPLSLSFIKGSFLTNYIYWLLPKQEKKSYLDFLFQAYNNDSVFKSHQKELELFINYSKENSAELIVVIFPFMQDYELSNKLYVNKLTKYFTEQNISYIDVADLAKELPLYERMINKNDAHASVKVNALVAQELLKKLNI